MIVPNLTMLMKKSGFHMLLLAMFWPVLAGCTVGNLPPAATSLPAQVQIVPGVTTAATTPDAGTTRSNDWLDLLQQQPYPYSTPLPPDEPTPLDGLYAKEEPISGTPVPCRRCPDYLAEDGVWKLSLDQGVYHIFHPPTGWHSLGSFSIEGSRLYLFNDPACHLVVGIYTWQLETTDLSLTVVEDQCQVERRADTFSNRAWRSCQPPNTEAAVTEHWSRPPGCDWPPE